MKKYVSRAFLIIFAALFIVIVFPVASNAAEAAALDESLVIHYDFEGMDIFDALKDKATAGEVNDELSTVAGFLNFQGLEIDTVNGTVTSTAAGNGLVTSWVDGKSDITAIGGSNTWFVRGKIAIPAGSTDTFFFVHTNSTKRWPYSLGYYANVKKFAVPRLESGNRQRNYMDEISDYAPEQYINIVTTLENQADGTAKLSFYYSYGLPQSASDWKLLNVYGDNPICTPQTTELLYLLTNNNHNGVAGVTLDDVRLYNKALTLDEIATIIPNGSFDGQLKQKPAETDTEPVDTTPAETQPTETQPTETQPTETTPKETEPAETNDTANSDSGAQDTTDTADDKKGCGATVSGAGLIMAALGLAVAVRSKKKQ